MPSDENKKLKPRVHQSQLKGRRIPYMLNSTYSYTHLQLRPKWDIRSQIYNHVDGTAWIQHPASSTVLKKHTQPPIQITPSCNM